LPLRAFLIFISLLSAVRCVSAADPGLRIGESEAKKAATEKPAPVYPLTARQLRPWTL